MEFSQFYEKLNDSERVLIGFGEAMKNVSEEGFKKLSELLKDKNYFILYMEDDRGLVAKYFDTERIAVATDIDLEAEKSEEIIRYTKWLSMTMNKKLLIMEMGASFLNPTALRWPLERITFLNDKAFFYRINGKLPQVAEEVASKSVPVSMKPEEFIDKL